MKAFFYTTLLLTLILLTVSSCGKKEKSKIEDAPIVIYDENNQPISNAEGVKLDSLGNVLTGDNASASQETYVKVANKGELQKLGKYSLVVASLSKPAGIKALKDFFERDKISYKIVTSPDGISYFVLHSSDSEEEVIQARASFLIENVVDKTRADVWKQYYIQLTDAFIMMKE